jgi:hypothetical protein
VSHLYRLLLGGGGGYPMIRVTTSICTDPCASKFALTYGLVCHGYQWILMGVCTHTGHITGWFQPTISGCFYLFVDGIIYVWLWITYTYIIHPFRNDLPSPSLWFEAHERYVEQWISDRQHELQMVPWFYQKKNTSPHCLRCPCLLSDFITIVVLVPYP